jgi:hypothetical protein
MNWTQPTLEEIKMDAEIGSYQEDGEPTPLFRHRPAPFHGPAATNRSRRGRRNRAPAG